MINMQELFDATLRATSSSTGAHLLKNSTTIISSCPVTQYASSLTIAAAAVAASVPFDYAMCKAEPSLLFAESDIPLPSNSPSSATHTSFPHPSSPDLILSRHEPLMFFNFDINPNTSVFTATFLVAFILQILGFYLFRYLVPHLSKENPKSTRGLSWVLTLFSSIILFTGAFTLSSNMEWNLSRASGVDRDEAWTLLSLRNFPKESDIATMYSAYFISYLICDLTLGAIHYRQYLDPLSGWVHHLGYLWIVSNATLQKNVSIFFAIGTPIECRTINIDVCFIIVILFQISSNSISRLCLVSTIFLASGHIFPKLRSDFLFAVAFITTRIVYPIVLLPELYLNVESRLCWKVALMALLLHVHWFRKFVQQQIRYHNVRKDSCSSISQSNSQPLASHAIAKKIDGTDYKYLTNQLSEARVKSLATDNTEGEPLKKNTMSDIGEAVINQVEVNQSRRSRQAKALRRSACPSFDSSAEGESDAIAAVVAKAVETLSKTEAPAMTVEAPAKTMQQLLDECEQEEFSYALPIQGINNNKTFSPQALMRLMSSQGPENAITGGALRLSRASSMRDSKRRIALDAVKFEDPKAKAPAARPKSVMIETPKRHFEAEATVVFRQRPTRSSVPMMSPVESNQGRNFDMGTIRAPRRVAVQT
ncbi:hypothetical protein BGX27_007842 [Mortierella sp. AM989]|nr:hypothetical protein BGX27_007842 [Mortierella sp. AM989]